MEYQVIPVITRSNMLARLPQLLNCNLENELTLEKYIIYFEERI